MKTAVSELRAGDWVRLPYTTTKVASVVWKRKWALKRDAVVVTFTNGNKVWWVATRKVNVVRKAPRRVKHLTPHTLLVKNKLEFIGELLGSLKAQERSTQRVGVYNQTIELVNSMLP